MIRISNYCNRLLLAAVTSIESKFRVEFDNYNLFCSKYCICIIFLTHLVVVVNSDLPADGARGDPATTTRVFRININTRVVVPSK